MGNSEQVAYLNMLDDCQQRMFGVEDVDVHLIHRLEGFSELCDDVDEELQDDEH